jgi:hypothetical protein
MLDRELRIEELHNFTLQMKEDYVCRKCMNYEEVHINFNCNSIRANASLGSRLRECKLDSFVSAHDPTADLVDDGNVCPGSIKIGNVLII